MCGIAGFIHNPREQAPSWANKPVLSAMLDKIAHRGPDGSGMELGQGYGLGHVRLSILDTSDAAHQPMWCSQKRYCLTYNGEIYNFKDIRSRLEAAGYKFRSSGDTEVLLYALIEWRKGALQKIQGMFAGAFYDTQNNTALVFRDHLGIKPLYYTWQGQSFVFASEVKALQPVIKSYSLNNNAVYEHIRYRYVGGERTLFNNIQRLPPGTLFEFENGALKARTEFYNVLDTIAKNGHSASDEEIETALNNAIREHTISDVGYSIQLSGGVDSSYITTVLSKQQEKLDTYSVSLPGDENDEKAYQDIVVEKCGTVHHDYPCDGKDFAALLPKACYHLDFPIVHAGSVFLFKLCQNIAKTHKVVLTGEGADELFLGYSRYDIPLAHKLAFHLRKLGFKPHHIPDLPKFRAIKNLVGRELGMEAGVFDSVVIENVLQTPKVIESRQNTAAPFPTLIHQLMASDQAIYLASLLERQDKVSMASSVETRVPFCHFPLFDLINPIPADKKTKPVPKAILKRLLRKHYEENFVYRRKVGFRLPIDQWIADSALLGQYLDLLQDSKALERGLYDKKILLKMVDDHKARKHDYSRELFGITSLEVWAREFGV